MLQLIKMTDDKPYSNREIQMKFDYLAEKIDNNHEETNDQINLLDRKIHDKHVEILGFLTEIKEQNAKSVKKTDDVEKDINEIKGWKSYIQGSFFVVGLILIPILLMLISQYIKGHG